MYMADLFVQEKTQFYIKPLKLSMHKLQYCKEKNRSCCIVDLIKIRYIYTIYTKRDDCIILCTLHRVIQKIWIKTTASSSVLGIKKGLDNYLVHSSNHPLCFWFHINFQVYFDIVCSSRKFLEIFSSRLKLV